MARNPNWTEDEIVLVIDLLQRTGAKVPDAKDREMISLSRRLQTLPIHSSEVRKGDFRSPNSVRLKCFNLLANEPGLYSAKNLVATNADVWRRYWGNEAAVATRVSAISQAAVELVATETVTDEDEGVEEGGIIGRAHKARERKKGLRNKFLKRFLETNNYLHCAGCTLSESAYSSTEPIVRVLFEVHHIRPLGHAGETPVSTKMSDLVLLCANCHRLIHGLMAKEDRVITVEELRSFLASAIEKK